MCRFRITRTLAWCKVRTGEASPTVQIPTSCWDYSVRCPQGRPVTAGREQLRKRNRKTHALNLSSPSRGLGEVTSRLSEKGPPSRKVGSHHVSDVTKEAILLMPRSNPHRSFPTLETLLSFLLHPAGTPQSRGRATRTRGPAGLRLLTPLVSAK